MKGIILAVSIQKGNGIISGDDGKRYRFLLSSWYTEQNPKQGLRVDFDTTPEGEALDIYQDISDISASPSSQLNPKNRIIAAILAFFLGAFGAHKFYLGYSQAAIIMLIVTLVSSFLLIPNLVIRIIAFIEFITYLTKSDQEFYDTYLKNKKAWF